MANSTSITITASAGLSAHGNDTLLFDFSQVRAQLPAAEADAFWGNVQTGGGDLRLYHGSTPRAIDLRRFDAATETGAMFIESVDHAANAATEWRLEFGDPSLSQPAPDAPLGYQAVYSGYRIVWTLDNQSLEDRTGRGNDIGSFTGAQNAQGLFGGATYGNNSNTIGQAPSTNDFSLFASGTKGTVTLLLYPDDTPDAGGLGRTIFRKSSEWAISTDNDYPAALRTSTYGSNNLGAVDSNVRAGQWNYGFVRVEAGRGYDTIVNDNPADVFNNGNLSDSNSELIYFFTNGPGSGDRYAGRVQEIRIRHSAMPDAYAEEEYHNLFNQSGFWSVQAAPAGISVSLAPASYSAASLDAGLYHGRRVGAASTTFTLGGQSAPLNTTRVLATDTHNYSYAGQPAQLAISYQLALPPADYTLSGTTMNLGRQQRLQLGIQAGEYSLAPRGVTVQKRFSTSFAPGSYSFTTPQQELRSGRRITAAAGRYNQAEAAAALLRARQIALRDGPYAFTGPALTLSLANRLRLAVAAGMYNSDGVTASLSLDRMMLLADGSFVLSGTRIDFTTGDDRLNPEVVALLSPVEPVLLQHSTVERRVMGSPVNQVLRGHSTI